MTHVDFVFLYYSSWSSALWKSTINFVGDQVVWSKNVYVVKVIKTLLVRKMHLEYWFMNICIVKWTFIQHIRWRFNPLRAPWLGGIWGYLIGIVKQGNATNKPEKVVHHGRAVKIAKTEYVLINFIILPFPRLNWFSYINSIVKTLHNIFLASGTIFYL